MTGKSKNRLPKRQRALVSLAWTLALLVPGTARPGYSGYVLERGSEDEIAAVEAWIEIDRAARAYPELKAFLKALLGMSFADMLTQMRSFADDPQMSQFVSHHEILAEAARAPADLELAHPLARAVTPGEPDAVEFPLEPDPPVLAEIAAGIGVLKGMAEDGNACADAVLAQLRAIQEPLILVLAIDAFISRRGFSRRAGERDMIPGATLSTYGVVCRELHGI